MSIYFVENILRLTKALLHSRSVLILIISLSPAMSSAKEIEEIIVTAQKRAESLQDVPLSMTAIEGSKIEEANINSFMDLSEYVPNLSITENAVNTIIGMRGVGIGANQSFEQSVGVYVDGIHYGKSRQIRTGLFDLQQVEVLRGPQGILFGKNTLAGAINITSATPEPDQELGGKLSVEAESFGGTTMEGHITGSMGDTLGLRFAYKDRSSDGHIHIPRPQAALNQLQRKQCGGQVRLGSQLTQLVLKSNTPRVTTCDWEEMRW